MNKSETLIHNLAKDIILEEEKFWLIGFDKDFHLFDIKTEHRLDGYTPDVFATYYNGERMRRLAIEICVTNPSSRDKILFYKNSDIDSIEVKVRNGCEMDYFDIDLLCHHIWATMTNPKNQRWLSLTNSSLLEMGKLPREKK